MEVEIVDVASALSFLQACYRNPSLNLTVRMRVAIACLPYEVPRLAVTAQITENDIATILDRRIARLRQMRLLENKPINGAATVTSTEIPAEPKPEPRLPAPLSRLYSSRFRRRI
jgi:hypothetical protein